MYRILLLFSIALLFFGCDMNQGTPGPQSASGITKASVKIEVGSDGMTEEQRNIKFRLEEDNRPGAVKHLYIISPYSGQVLLYSTVQGKVTSSGKRLTPTTVSSMAGEYINDTYAGARIDIGGRAHRTTEVLQDDGTYGSSADYLYWWDTRDTYHQHFITGGQIIHVSEQPIAVAEVVINLETAQRASEPR